MTSKYQLYYSPGACSMAIHVLLHELNQPLDLIKVDLRAPRDPAFLRISPRGQVPTLVEDSVPIVEGAAIILHLCDKFRSELMPAEGLARAKALEALMFCNATLHPAYGKALLVEKTPADDAAKAPFRKAAAENLQKLWDQVEEQLGHHKYMAGDQMTVADILVTVFANWSFVPVVPKIGPNTKRLVAEVSQRPAYQLALQHEGVEYKAAA